MMYQLWHGKCIEVYAFILMDKMKVYAYSSLNK